MTRTIYFVIILLFVLSLSAQNEALDGKAVFNQANQAFDKEEYSQAIRLYEDLASEYESMQLFHNLSLAYYYEGDLARSILYMERAKRLAPLNSDVTKNLRLLYENVDSDITYLPPFFLKAWWNAISRLLSPIWWLIIHLLLLISAVYLLYKYLIENFDLGLHFYYIRGIIIGLFLTSVITAALSHNATLLRSNTDHAIVMQNNTPVRAGAETNALEIDQVNSGVKVKIEDEINELYKVKLGDLTEGWIHKDQLEII